MSPHLWKERLLPAVIFLPLSFGISTFLFSYFVPRAGVGPKLQAQCHAPDPGTVLPYWLAYTGIPAIDKPMCTYVAFFHAVMGESSLPFTADFLVSFSTYAVIPYIEAARNGRSILLAFPLLVGLCYQYFSIAITYPLYWALFLWSGGGSLHKRSGGENSMIDQAHAEAILFSLFIGYFIPTAAMFVLEDPHVTAIWQVFPIWMTLAQWAHRLGRPSYKYPYSGYKTVRATYILLFIVTSSYHISIIWPKLLDLDALGKLFNPNVSPSDMSLELGSLGFLTWDAIFGTAAIVLASFWFVRSVKELFALVAWYVLTIVPFGPGASLAGVFLWRESILNTMRLAEANTKTPEKK